MLSEKKSITVINKIDALDKKSILEKVLALSCLTDDVYTVSAVSGKGMIKLLRRLKKLTSPGSNDSERKNNLITWAP